jgi:DNA primase
MNSPLVRPKTVLKTSSADGVSPPPRNPGARRIKEEELCRYLLEDPDLASKYAELLATLQFSTPLLDRLRQELLNVAASGSRLEKQGLENHLVRTGMADLVERLKAPGTRNEGIEGSALGEDADAGFLRAASQLREMAELDPERHRALERF